MININYETPSRICFSSDPSYLWSSFYDVSSQKKFKWSRCWRCENRKFHQKFTHCNCESFHEKLTVRQAPEWIPFWTISPFEWTMQKRQTQNVSVSFAGALFTKFLWILRSEIPSCSLFGHVRWSSIWMVQVLFTPFQVFFPLKCWWSYRVLLFDADGRNFNIPPPNFHLNCKI